LACTNLKCGTDSLLFVYDPDHLTSASDLAMLSLNRSDRVRLINFDPELIQAIRNVVLNFHQTKEPETRNYYGAYEFKLKGYPFSSTGNESVAARQLVCKLLEAYRDQGWECTAALDLSRKTTDKSCFLFRRAESAVVKVSCMALSDADRLRLLDFPPSTSAALAANVAKCYLPGVEGESSVDASRLELDLHGSPWTQSSAFSLHARSMLCRLLGEAAKRGWRLTASADVCSQFVHQENGTDYHMDVHSWFFLHQGLFKGAEVRTKSGKKKGKKRAQTATSYAELRVSDLEGSVFPSYGGRQ